jgi:hypothetical protein
MLFEGMVKGKASGKIVMIKVSAEMIHQLAILG